MKKYRVNKRIVHHLEVVNKVCVCFDFFLNQVSIPVFCAGKKWKNNGLFFHFTALTVPRLGCSPLVPWSLWHNPSTLQSAKQPNTHANPSSPTCRRSVRKAPPLPRPRTDGREPPPRIRPPERPCLDRQPSHSYNTRTTQINARTCSAIVYQIRLADGLLPSLPRKKTCT